MASEGAKEKQSLERISSVLTVDDPRGSCMLKLGKAGLAKNPKPLEGMKNTRGAESPSVRSGERKTFRKTCAWLGSPVRIRGVSRFYLTARRCGREFVLLSLFRRGRSVLEQLRNGARL